MRHGTHTRKRSQRDTRPERRDAQSEQERRGGEKKERKKSCQRKKRKEERKEENVIVMISSDSATFLSHVFTHTHTTLHTQEERRRRNTDRRERERGRESLVDGIPRLQRALEHIDLNHERSEVSAARRRASRAWTALSSGMSMRLPIGSPGGNGKKPRYPLLSYPKGIDGGAKSPSI